MCHCELSPPNNSLEQKIEVTAFCGVVRIFKFKLRGHRAAFCRPTAENPAQWNFCATGEHGKPHTNTENLTPTGPFTHKPETRLPVPAYSLPLSRGHVGVNITNRDEVLGIVVTHILSPPAQKSG